MKVHLGAVVLLALVGGQPVTAHHLITEVYDVDETTTVEGRVERLVFADPHTFVHLAVEGERGRTRTWAIELEGADTLAQHGIDRATLQRGDILTVCGNPGRDASQFRLLMLSLQRSADGLALRRAPVGSNAECHG